MTDAATYCHASNYGSRKRAAFVTNKRFPGNPAGVKAARS